MRYRLVIQILLSTIALFALQSPAVRAADNAAHVLRVGFVPGPYADEFREGVEPQLKRKGYTVQYVNFSTGLEANQAVWHNEIAADVMQHSVYLKAYNDRNGTDLVGVVQVPTPPMGLYSTRHHSLSEVKAGATVAVPNDPVNLDARSRFFSRLAGSAFARIPIPWMFRSVTWSPIPPAFASSRSKPHRRRVHSKMSISRPSRATSPFPAGTV
jgi:D-methionine transport system substrate-binding protein